MLASSIRITLSVGIALLVLGTLPAPAGETFTTTTFVETFDAASNEGAWTYGTGNEQILLEGGNPGAYLRDTTLVTFTPKASTSFGVGSPFTGNYAARGVSELGIDLAIASAEGSYSSRTLTLILLNDNGTPADLEDDWGAYHVTQLALPPSGVIGLTESDILQWVPYTIAVPSSSKALPQGWTWISRNYVRTGGSWARLMREVSHVGFLFGDPASLYPLFTWDVALDNPRITSVN